MSLKRIAKWLFLGSLGLVAAVVVALVLVISIRPEVVEGTDRPSWLPETATGVSYRSRGGFGWSKVAEFTISEKDFRAYAAAQGWVLSGKSNYSPPTLQILRQPHDRPFTAGDDLKLLPQALVYERRAANNGGITVAFDPLTARAYYHQSHR